MLWFKIFWKKICRAINAFKQEEVPEFSSLKQNISRDKLKRNSRILFIDDEKIELVEDLKKEGFSADQDFTGNDSLVNIERGMFDLVILDFKGVGKKYGGDDGLSLLRSIKRVNPSLYVLAYTSQNLSPAQSSEFYTLCDGTLIKDIGVADSVQRIEDALRAAAEPKRIWHGILKSMGIEENSDRAKELEKKIMKAILNNKKEEALACLGEEKLGFDGSLISSLIEKLISFGFDRLVNKP